MGSAAFPEDSESETKEIHFKFKPCAPSHWFELPSEPEEAFASIVTCFSPQTLSRFTSAAIDSKLIVVDFAETNEKGWARARDGSHEEHDVPQRPNLRTPL